MAAVHFSIVLVSVCGYFVERRPNKRVEAG